MPIPVEILLTFDDKGAILSAKRLGTVGKQAGAEVNRGMAEGAAGAAKLKMAMLAVAASAAVVAVAYKAAREAMQFLDEAIDAAAEAEIGERKLAAVIKATGGAAGLTLQQMKAYAGQLQNLTTFEDDTTIAAMGLLATFRHVNGEVFTRGISLAQDLATVMGVDLNSAVRQLGKALDDPAQGMSMLSRVGVTFTESQKKAAEALQATGDRAGAQKIILDALAEKMGGVAAAAADTYTGRMIQMKNAYGNLQETVGTAITQNASVRAGIIAVTDALTGMTSRLSENGKITATVNERVSDLAIGALELVRVLNRVASASVIVAEAMTGTYAMISAKQAQFYGEAFNLGSKFILMQAKVADAVGLDTLASKLQITGEAFGLWAAKYAGVAVSADDVSRKMHAAIETEQGAWSIRDAVIGETIDKMRELRGQVIEIGELPPVPPIIDPEKIDAVSKKLKDMAASFLPTGPMQGDGAPIADTTGAAAGAPIAPSSASAYTADEAALVLHLEKIKEIKAKYHVEGMVTLAEQRLQVDLDEKMQYAAQLEMLQMRLIDETAYQAELTRIKKEASDKRKDIDAQEAEAKKKLDMQELGRSIVFAGQTIMMLAGHNKKMFAMGKAAAASGAIIETAHAISKANALGYPMAIPAIIFAAATGAAQLAAIINAKPPAYSQGTPYVPETGMALIHKGEQITPAKFNPFGPDGRMKGGGSDYDPIGSKRGLSLAPSPAQASPVNITLTVPNGVITSQDTIARLGSELEQAVKRGMYQREVA